MRYTAERFNEEQWVGDVALDRAYRYRAWKRLLHFVRNDIGLKFGAGY